jgi:hypothetical protein
MERQVFKKSTATALYLSAPLFQKSLDGDEGR